MQPLKNVIAAVRRELEAALQATGHRPGEPRLEAERAVLTLELVVCEQTGQEGLPELRFGVPDRGAGNRSDGGPAHTLAIEFRSRQGPTSGEGSDPSAVRPEAEAAPCLEGEEARVVREAFAAVFGEPGFDSSARATVFREALAGLDDSQIGDILRSLDIPAGSEAVPALRKSRGMLCRLITSGPTKSISRGAEILLRVFRRHSAKSIIRFVGDVWMTQDDWLDRPPPRPARPAGPPSGG